MCMCSLDLPLYALQRTAPDRWSVLSPNADPFLPAVCAVAVLLQDDLMIDLNKLWLYGVAVQQSHHR